MITVKQAKDFGVVFVEGDEISLDTISEHEANVANKTSRFDRYQVISFTGREHTGDEMPCDGDLPVFVTTNNGLLWWGWAHSFNWGGL